MKKLIIPAFMAVLAGIPAFALSGSPFLENPGEGTSSAWVSNSTSVVDFAQIMTFEEADYGAAVEMVTGEGGKVWVNYLLSSFPTTGWAEGQVSGNDLTFTLPQEIYQESGKSYYLALFDMDDEGSYVLSKDQSLKFFKSGNSWLSTIDTQFRILGLASETGDFTMVGAFNITLTPFVEPEPEDVSGVDFKDYAFVSGENGHFLKVGVTSDKVYIKGLLSDEPDVCMAGTRAGNKVTFKSGAYLGISQEGSSVPHYNYFMAARDLLDDYEGIGEMTFDLDETTGKLTSDGTFLFNHTPQVSIISYWNYFPEPRLFMQNPDKRLVPANPTKVSYKPEGDNFIAYIPQLSVDGDLLDADLLYYQVFVNGEPYTFYNDEYKYLDMETMTLVPYNYTEDYDFMINKTYHQIYLYSYGISVIGVQSVYEGPGGTTYSDIVNSDGTVIKDESGVNEVLQETTQEGRAQYYDLLGRRVSPDSKGIKIRLSGNRAIKIMR